MITTKILSKLIPAAFIFLLNINLSYSQKLTPTVFASSGEVSTNQVSGNSLSWTLGEVVTETIGNDNILTQGFQQEKLQISSVFETLDLSLNLYPNPTQSILYIDGLIGDNLLYTLSNSKGQIIEENQINSSIQSIRLQNYTAGIYFLQIIEVSSGKLNTYKIIKQ